MMTHAFPYRQKSVPLDPPTIRRNPVRQLTVELKGEPTAESTPGTILSSEIRTAVEQQLGYEPSKVVVQSSQWWAPGGSEVTLTVEEKEFGLVCSDSGSYTHRARCGIAIPAHRQKVLPKNTSDTLYSYECTEGVTIHFHVSTWGAASTGPIRRVDVIDVMDESQVLDQLVGPRDVPAGQRDWWEG